jgi:putative aldouronate transport system permease protein
MLLPVLGFYILFKYVPMYGVQIAFKKYNVIKGIWGSEWIGLEIFTEVFENPDFWTSLLNTIRLNLLSLITGFPAPIIFALFLNEIRSKKYKKTVQSISYLPHFISWVIIYGIMLTFLVRNTGLVNVLLKRIGLPQVSFLTQKGWWYFIYLGSGIWKELGWSAIIYLAAMSAIDTQLYEAAAIDGAGRLKRMWYITLPGIKNTIVLLFILRIGQMMNIGFEQPFLLGNPLVADISTVISVYVYQMGLIWMKFSFSTAVGFFQSVVNLILLVSADYIARLLGEQGIWGGRKH